jgi:D-serine deaminase-like pyridoxal phosphate-dependent protein
MSTLDWRVKGLWLADGPATGVADFVAAGHHLFDGPFTWPVLVARRSAIEANIATMATYCARHGVDFAPHGKTAMAPALFAAQLAAGAWGITVATANQALVARHAGVPRILLANELLDVRALRWAAGLAAEGIEFLCYVDSVAGVEILAEALRGHPGRLRVLVELGFPGGRTGCRSIGEVAAVATAATAVDRVEVAGVAGFEGMLPGVVEVESFLRALVEASAAIGHLCPGPPIVSAGGSAFFDVVTSILAGSLLADRQVILRSGATVSHDDGLYAAKTPFGRHPDEGSLTAALQLWAQVLSAPEPGLVIAGAGKRDAPFDEGLPLPLRVRGRDGTLRSAAGATVERLNDQHAYVRGLVAEPGELICFGISHPCTAFDKWRVIPLIDDAYQIVDVIHTYF